MFRRALLGMCVLNVCDLETSTVKWPRPELGCKKEIGRYKRRRRRIISRRMEYKKIIVLYILYALFSAASLHRFSDDLVAEEIT